MQKYILLLLMLISGHLLIAQADRFKEISTPNLTDVLTKGKSEFDYIECDYYLEARGRDSIFKLGIKKYNDGKYKEAISILGIHNNIWMGSIDIDSLQMQQIALNRYFYIIDDYYDTTKAFSNLSLRMNSLSKYLEDFWNIVDTKKNSKNLGNYKQKKEFLKNFWDIQIQLNKQLKQQRESIMFGEQSFSSFEYQDRTKDIEDVLKLSGKMKEVVKSSGLIDKIKKLEEDIDMIEENIIKGYFNIECHNILSLKEKFHIVSKTVAIEHLRRIYKDGIKLSIFTELRGEIDGDLFQNICTTYTNLIERTYDPDDVIYGDASFKLELEKANNFINQLMIGICSNFVLFQEFRFNKKISDDTYFYFVPEAYLLRDSCSKYLKNDYSIEYMLRIFTPATSVFYDAGYDASNRLTISNLLGGKQVQDYEFDAVYDLVVRQMAENAIFFDALSISYFYYGYTYTNKEPSYRITKSFFKSLDYLHGIYDDVYQILNDLEKTKNISERQTIRIDELKAHLYYRRANLHHTLYREREHFYPVGLYDVNAEAKKALSYLGKMHTITSKLYPLEGEYVSLELEHLRCLNTLAQINEEIGNVNKRRKFRAEKQELSIVQLDNAETRDVVDNVKRGRNMIIGVSILIILAFCFLIYRGFILINRQKNKLSELQKETAIKIFELSELEEKIGDLNKANTTITEQKKEVEQQRNKLKVINKQLEIEQYRVNKYRRAMSHRIKNGLGGISSRLDLIEGKFRLTENNDTTLQVIREVKSRVYTTAKLHLLLNEEVDKPHIDIKDFIGEMRTIYNMYDDYEAENYHFEAIDFSLRLRPEIIQDMGLIIDELISNAWVHSRYRPRYLKVSLVKTDELLIVEVQDTKEIYSKQSEILYDGAIIQVEESTPDSNLNSNKSKGHIIIKELTKKYKGVFRRRCNEDGVGSIYFINFDIKKLDYE